jgi:hypothetical protein
MSAVRWLAIPGLVAAACASGERAPPVATAQTFAPDTGTAAATSTVPAPPAPPATPAKAASIELTFAGDVMFGRFHDKQGFRPIRAERHDPFTEVAPLLDSDLAMVNLETPAMKNPPRKSKYGTRMRFVAPPARVATLVKNHVDMVTLANNHFWDMHAEGVNETPVVLAEVGLRWIGAARREDPLFRVETTEVKGWKVGFIAAAAVCNTHWESAYPKLPYAVPEDFADQVVPVVTSARADHDLVIVVVHWGDEYQDAPKGWQVRAAHRMIDAGADAVIGHHPHVLQGIERYKDGLIAYSLGNFLFDNTTTVKKYSGVLRLEYARAPADPAACLDAATFHPVVVVPPDKKVPVHRPTVARGKKFTIVAERLQKVSKAKVMTRTEWTVAGDAVTTAGTCAP